MQSQEHYCFAVAKNSWNGLYNELNMQSTRLNILWVTRQIPHFPAPGGETRQYCLLRELASKHNIHVLVPSYSDIDPLLTKLEQLDLQVHKISSATSNISANTKVSQFKSSLVPEMVLGLNKWKNPFTQVLERLSRTHFDIVQIEQSHLAGLLFDSLPPASKYLVDMYDLMSDIQWAALGQIHPLRRRLYWFTDWFKLYQYENWIAAAYSHCLVMSQVDRRRLQWRSPKAQISVVPNCVDVDYFQVGLDDSKKIEEPPTLVMTGLMNYRPNVDGVVYFTNQVLPLVWHEIPEARFFIVGKYPNFSVQELARDSRVIVTGSVEDVRPYLAQATVVVAPLRQGSGTRLKILEAWAMKKAVISTPKGCEGLAGIHERHLMIGTSPQELAHQVLDLIRNPGKRMVLGQNAYELVRQKYLWSDAANVLNQVYERSLHDTASNK